jgi:beta-galactosidase
VLRTTADLHLSWDVPYEPGTLKAVGVKDGQIVLTVEVSTTGDPAAVSLSIDRDTIAADRRDVAHATLRNLDEAGRVVPVANSEVTLEVEGEGKLIGMDNGDPASHEDYKSNRRKAFNGLCLAIVQATAKPGAIRLTTSSPSLKQASVVITSK